MIPSFQSMLGRFLLTGIEAYQNHRWSIALQHLTIALMLLPKSAAARFYRASIYERLGQQDLARLEYIQACQDDPDYYPAWIACGKLAILTEQQFEQALTAFQNAARLAPTEDRAQIGIAITSLCLKYPHAIAYNACQAAIALNPQNSYYYEVRAIANIQMGNYRAALEDLHTALDGNPCNLRIFLNRSSIYYELNEPQKAQSDLEAILQKTADPKIASIAHARLGILYARQENLLPAFVEFDKGFGYCPTSALLLVCRAQGLVQLSQFQAAIEDYNEAILLDPERIEWVFERMQVRYWLKDFEGCLQDASLVVRKMPNQGQAIFFQALAKVQLPNASLPEIMEALQKATRIFEVEANWSWLMKAEEAIRLAKSALAKD
jgi:tetratricopeptide (TPR) repeat protein